MSLDDISMERLSQVHPELSRRIQQLAELLSFPIRVTQGLRTYSQQDALYQQGRTTPGKVVTNAAAGFSMHNFGMAVDLVPMKPDGSVDWDDKSAQWDEMLAKAPSCGLAEGAQWRAFPDMPHFYIEGCPASPDDNVRYLFENGGLAAVWSELIKS